jgi:molybdate transport system substrate-binding protein
MGRWATALLALALAIPACGTDRDALTLHVASSLTDVGESWAEAYTEDSGEPVLVNAAGTPSLVAQVLAGAPADVLVTADERSMSRVTDGGHSAEGPIAVAGNEAVVVTHPDVRGITAPADLEGADVTLALCAPEVPCGAAAERLLAGIDVEPVTFEPAVRSVLTKVAIGEVDAGVVYRTDAERAGDDVRVIDRGPAPPVETTYLAAALSQDERAAELLALIAGPRGRAILNDHGFSIP